MFKILQLQPGVDDQLQEIQTGYEVDQVINLGADSSFNHYLLVQYDTLPPNQTPATGSVIPVQDSAKKPAKAK